MAVRQRLRRSSTPPQMLISSGRCGRPGGLDVQTITLGDRTRAEPAPWIVADFSAINAHDPRDWVAIARRAALQRLVLPLPTLHDIAYHQRQEKVSEEYGEPGMGDYVSLFACGQSCVKSGATTFAPKRITNLRSSLLRPRLRDV